MHEPLTIRECKREGLFRTFAICVAETQEPIEGFENIIGNEEEVTALAHRLSYLDHESEIDALREEIKQRSSKIEYDFYGHLSL